MADISVSPKPGGMHNEALVAWTVDLDGVKSRGTCTVSDDDHVLKIATTEQGGGSDAGGALVPPLRNLDDNLVCVAGGVL